MKKIDEDKKLCKCGCGEVVKSGCTYIHGHNQRGKKVTLSEKHKQALHNSWRGKKHSKETIKILQLGNSTTFREGHHHGLNVLEKLSGENGSNWRNGVTKDSYPEEYYKFIKPFIFHRDGYKCQMDDWCKCNSNRMVIHHVDHHKFNCTLKNLVTVCNSCNPRLSWKFYENPDEYKEICDKYLNH